MAFDKLFSPMKIGPVEIKNRIIMAPMAVCLAYGENTINDTYVNYFAARAKGGAGLVTTCGICIDDDTCGMPEPGAFSLTKREQLDSAKRMVDLVHAYGGKICFQLLHPGRQSMSAYSHGQQPVAPSELKEADWAEMPHALTVDEIHSIVDNYVRGAKLALEAGADGIDIHCAHGYLIHSFLSPRANKRTDEYGGSFEKRLRFITEVLQAVRAVIPNDRFLTCRLNASDGLVDGLQRKDCIEIAKYVESLGVVDAISISHGTYSTKDMLIDPQVWPEGCRTEMIREFRSVLKTPLLAANHIKRPAMAEQMLEDDLCDFVVLGRPMMADPNWAIKAQTGKADQIRYCISCGTCNAMTGMKKPNVCALNPYNDHEFEYNERTIKKDGALRKIVVIGGGVVGMEAATLAAERGFSVTLFNADSHLGGALDLGRAVPGMEKKGWAINGFVNRMMAAGVDIRLNTPITSAEQITSLNPYAVVVATGASPIVPDVPGVKKPIVTQAWHAARNLEDYAGKKVAFVGSGLTGLEIAYGLAAKGADVAIYEQEEKICPKASGVSENKNKTALIQELDKCKASYHLNMELAEITDTGAVFKDTKTGETLDVKADAVVLSLGTTPNTQVEELLKGKVEKLIVAGDCAGATRLLEGTSEVFRAVWNV